MAQIETVTVDRPGVGICIINKADRLKGDKEPKPAGPAKGDGE